MEKQKLKNKKNKIYFLRVVFFVFSGELCHCERQQSTDCCPEILLWRICFSGRVTTSVSLQVFLSDLNKICSFPSDCHTISPISSFAEICPVVSPLIHVEYRTEGSDEANRRFSRLYEDNKDKKSETRLRRFPFRRPVEGQRFLFTA